MGDYIFYGALTLIVIGEGYLLVRGLMGAWGMLGNTVRRCKEILVHYYQK